MAKSWKIKIDGLIWTCREAQAILDDQRTGGGFGQFNHPAIWFEFRRPPCAGYTEDVKVKAVLRFQRNAPDGELRFWKPAQYRMDTRARWSAAYAGRIELDSAGEARLEAEYRLSVEDRVRIRIASDLRAAIKEYNLGHVHPEDQMEQAIAAAEKLGASVDWMYREHDGLVPLYGAVKRGANAEHDRPEGSAVKESA